MGWLLGAAKGFAIKIVNPGGVENWKYGKNVHNLDDEVIGFGVTPRQIGGGKLLPPIRSEPRHREGLPLRSPPGQGAAAAADHLTVGGKRDGVGGRVHGRPRRAPSEAGSEARGRIVVRTFFDHRLRLRLRARLLHGGSGGFLAGRALGFRGLLLEEPTTEGRAGSPGGGGGAGHGLAGLGAGLGAVAPATLITLLVATPATLPVTRSVTRSATRSVGATASPPIATFATAIPITALLAGARTGDLRRALAGGYALPLHRLFCLLRLLRLFFTCRGPIATLVTVSTLVPIASTATATAAVPVPAATSS